jgi:hypothetical protein
MAVEDSLLLSFHEAKQALFAALRSQCQPAVAHTLSVPPAHRGVVRTTANTSVPALLGLERELEVLQLEAKEVHGLISRQRVAAQMFLQPIGRLPPELIQEIVAWAAVDQLEDYRQVLGLSHASKLWRNVVVGFSALFIHANWNEWPASIIELWCSRVAKPNLLTIYLAGIYHQRDGRGLLG